MFIHHHRSAGHRFSIRMMSQMLSPNPTPFLDHVKRLFDQPGLRLLLVPLVNYLAKRSGKGVERIFYDPRGSGCTRPPVAISPINTRP